MKNFVEQEVDSFLTENGLAEEIRSILEDFAVCMVLSGMMDSKVVKDAWEIYNNKNKVTQ